MTRSERQRKAYREYKERQLRDPQFREAFEEGLDKLRLGASVAALRRRMNLSQAQLAALIHSSQSVISRLERGENVQLETVHKVARALQARVKLELLPQEKRSDQRSIESSSARKGQRS